MRAGRIFSHEQTGGAGGLLLGAHVGDDLMGQQRCARAPSVPAVLGDLGHCHAQSRIGLQHALNKIARVGILGLGE